MGRNFGVNETPTEWYTAEDVHEATTINFWIGTFAGIVVSHAGWLLAFWAMGWI